MESRYGGTPRPSRPYISRHPQPNRSLFTKLSMVRSCDFDVNTLHNNGCAVRRSSSPNLSKIQSRKRVRKACDACRFKKSKCDGRNPCSRCIVNNKICTFTNRQPSLNRLISAPYVGLLESRINVLQQGLEMLIQCINRRDSIINCLMDEDGKITINHVLSKLSVQGFGTRVQDRLSSTTGASNISTSDTDGSEEEDTESETDHGLNLQQANVELVENSQTQPAAAIKSEEYMDNYMPQVLESTSEPQSYPSPISSPCSVYSEVMPFVATSAMVSTGAAPSQDLQQTFISVLPVVRPTAAIDILPAFDDSNESWDAIDDWPDFLVF
ncbi:hypothetical protein V1517DRAFT_324751 [Lipomyces orientalis]|uniref:Uncharacterized protein n=1 Tax=Lipomyces orientalis TaxID=1233043 RepID=A0ACC3TMA1_9ASCO